jgi:hypothetical protein
MSGLDEQIENVERCFKCNYLVLTWYLLTGRKRKKGYSFFNTGAKGNFVAESIPDIYLYHGDTLDDVIGIRCPQCNYMVTAANNMTFFKSLKQVMLKIKKIRKRF